ncbi:MAG: hypothetical protein YSLV7_ORF14 [Yellowstone Lake virophage 7]|uniref:hypothetical protein n=1 Tax=Yellowstone Lake virophage 7 TaxID=1557035 RepID=UPI00053602BB|nr:MAG: hypothetical protein ASQ67_gp14 [Yellowstone Lake virophage 7]AIW01933.1 MAG: hypothetical protein YSLV7_ORF14 [Yellowstone Lake virophage 7]
MFAKFMKNNAKRELAKAQGIPIDKIVRIKKERKQPLLKLTDTKLNFDYLEQPIFEEFKDIKQEQLEPKLRPQRVDKFIPKADITFIVPKPLPSKIKDIKKNYINIEDTISSLFYDSENIIPFYKSNTILGNLASLSIIKRYGGNCIVHDAMKTMPDKNSLNFGLYFNVVPFKSDVIDYKKLGEQLADCKRRNVPIIMFPIYMVIKYKDENDRYITEGHTNLCIYRPFKKNIELFEPLGELQEGLGKK